MLPAVGYVVRMLDGYIDVQGTTAELRERKLLQSIVHDEEANAETPKPDAGLEAQESVTATFSDAGDTKITETKKPRDLITTEARAVGRVSSRVYMVYMKATCVYPLFMKQLILQYYAGHTICGLLSLSWLSCSSSWGLVRRYGSKFGPITTPKKCHLLSYAIKQLRVMVYPSCISQPTSLVTLISQL